MSIEPGVLIGFVLTLFIYSYLVRDNPLYRLAIHILVGVSAAYSAVVVINQIIWPVFQQIRQDPTDPAAILWLVPILLALLLFLRHLPGASWLSGGTLAFLVGVGAAVALTGAISGTLWPQVITSDAEKPVQSLIVALLTVCTLFAFQFTGRINAQGEWVRPIWQRGLALIGQTVLTITFGALFTTVFSTSLILLIDRVDYYLDQFTQLLQ
jgi:hypothetical protein